MTRSVTVDYADAVAAFFVPRQEGTEPPVAVTGGSPARRLRRRPPAARDGWSCSAVAQAIAGHRSRVVHGLVLAALRSFGCDDDARLAFHAEAAGDGVAVLRYAAAAQYERALRFAASADPVTLAGLYEGLADEITLLDRWDDAETAGERALTLWREAGDRLREGDALRRLSRIRWNLCRGREAVDAAEAAVSALEPLGPSVELARAYATFANQRMLYADYDVAIDLARRAQALAIRFGATDVHSDALNTQAASRSAQGLDWAGQMREALGLALAGGHHHEAGRAYTNLSGIHAGKREFAEAERYLEPGIAFCDEHDITTFAICMRGEHANLLERTGRWDEAVALSTEILIKVGPSPANRLCSLIRLGRIGARRGEPGAWEYLDEAAATADEAGEPQNQIPARLARAEAYWLEGKLDAARREAGLAHDVCTTPNAWLRGAVAVWLRRLGSPRSEEGEVAEPYRLVLQGDPVGAAQAWTSLGPPYEAAMALADVPDEEALREALGNPGERRSHPPACHRHPPGHPERPAHALGVRAAQRNPAVSTLTTTMQDSIAADRDYQSWMKDFASAGSPCGSDPSQDSNYAAAVKVSGEATIAKNAFVAIWDPMARRYGQLVYTSTGF
jgi:tetratricopeptide (TPR) repeat protein